MIGLTLIDDRGNWLRVDYDEVGNQELIVPLRNSLPNTI